MVVGWMGQLANTSVVAQEAAINTKPSSAASVATAPGGAASTVEPTALDSGLWEGANVGPHCFDCDDGVNAPPEWYTLQGARVLSRSCPRKTIITYQTPKNGYYQASLGASSSSEYFVKNLDVPTGPSTFSSVVGVYVTNPYQVANTNQFGMGVAPAYEMSLGHYVCRDRNNNDHFIEFQFWGLASWSSAKSLGGYTVPVYKGDTSYQVAQAEQINSGALIPTAVPGAYVGSLRTGFPTARELTNLSSEQKTLSVAFNYGTGEYMSYRSTMNNFELNGRLVPRGESDRVVLDPSGRWKRECQEGTYMSYLYGIRFMQIDESFLFQSQGQGQWGSDWSQEIQHANGEYDAFTHNSLLGLQIGTEMTFRHCKWDWGFQAKAGPYLNFANQTSTINAYIVDGTPHDPYERRFVKDFNNAAIIGEVGVHGAYKIRPNVVAKAQYDFMWIAGVALAPEQLQMVAEPVNRINTNGSIYSHGISLGLEWMR
jgi:hypothetical protein